MPHVSLSRLLGQVPIIAARSAVEPRREEIEEEEIGGGFLLSLLLLLLLLLLRSVLVLMGVVGVGFLVL